MSCEPYIPRSDESFRTWAEHFVHQLHAHPEAFMLTSGQTKYLVEACEEFNAAYQLAAADGTRTRPKIIAKQDARSILETMCRDIAAMIRPNQGISDEAKIAAGVPPRNTSHKRRTCPQISPELSYIGSTPGFETLKVTDPMTDRQKKPYNAARIQLWVAWTPIDAPPPKRDQAVYFNAYRSSPIHVPIEQDKLGLTATYWARYVGHRDDVGPWSLPTSAHMAHQAIIAERMKQKAKQAQADDHEGESDQPMKQAA